MRLENKPYVLVTPKLDGTTAFDLLKRYEDEYQFRDEVIEFGNTRPKAVQDNLHPSPRTKGVHALVYKGSILRLHLTCDLLR